LFLEEDYFTPFATKTLVPTVGSGKTRSKVHQISPRNATGKSRDESESKCNLGGTYPSADYAEHIGVTTIG